VLVVMTRLGPFLPPNKPASSSTALEPPWTGDRCHSSIVMAVETGIRQCCTALSRRDADYGVAFAETQAKHSGKGDQTGP
jgi:hypothetical protein